MWAWLQFSLLLNHSGATTSPQEEIDAFSAHVPSNTSSHKRVLKTVSPVYPPGSAFLPFSGFTSICLFFYVTVYLSFNWLSLHVYKDFWVFACAFICASSLPPTVLYYSLLLYLTLGLHPHCSGLDRGSEKREEERKNELCAISYFFCHVFPGSWVAVCCPSGDQHTNMTFFL